jgi:2-dehydro-3-deoxygluconokinase
MRPDEIDWDHIFGALGVRWFHTGGIFTFLSASCGEVVERAIAAANRHGTIVSYDVNYRASHWADSSEIGRKQALMKRVLAGVDVLFAGPHDLSTCLGLTSLPGASALGGSVWMSSAGEALSSMFPRLQVLATTTRAVTSATLNQWGAMAWHNGKTWEGSLHPALEVYDRVGGGDAFAAGFIYGLLNDTDLRRALEYGIAHGALTMTTPGDSSTATLAEVEHLMRGEQPYARR